MNFCGVDSRLTSCLLHHPIPSMQRPELIRSSRGTSATEPNASSYVGSTVTSLAKSPDPERSATDVTPISSQFNDTEPYIRYAYAWYLATFLPVFTILVLSFSFALYQHIHETVAAPRWISNRTLQNPRQTTQIATILASLLAAAIKWSLSKSAVNLAKKRFLTDYYPVFDMETFAALKNISVVPEYKQHKMVLLFSFLVVVACGLLTSGFVALIAPFAIAQDFPISGLTELNIAEADVVYSSWYNQTVSKLWRPNPANPKLALCGDFAFPGFSLSSCFSTRHFPQTLSAVSATILGYFASTLPSGKHINFVSSYPTLNNTRILGGTAGTLPVGPAGIHVPSDPRVRVMDGNFNYTAKLQGLWLEASCAYEQNSALQVVYVAGSGSLEPAFNIACPGSSTSRPYPIDSEDMNGMVIAHQCISQDTISVYWRSFDPTGNSTFDSIDFVRCDLAPRVGDVDAILQTSLSAFMMHKAPGVASPTTPLARGFMELALQETDKAMRLANTPAGNLFMHVVKEFAQTYGGVSPTGWVQPNNVVPTLLGLVLQGIFEFQVSEIRLLFTVLGKSVSRAPPACFRSVKCDVIESLVGWKIQRTTVIGLTPLLLISFLTIVIIAQSIRIPGRLPKFDPTNPTSLVAATSQGDIKFSGKSALRVGDPDDEVVWDTEVSFKENMANGGWGFKMKEKTN